MYICVLELALEHFISRRGLYLLPETSAHVLLGRLIHPPPRTSRPPSNSAVAERVCVYVSRVGARGSTKSALQMRRARSLCVSEFTPSPSPLAAALTLYVVAAILNYSAQACSAAVLRSHQHVCMHAYVYIRIDICEMFDPACGIHNRVQGKHRSSAPVRLCVWQVAASECLPRYA